MKIVIEKDRQVEMTIKINKLELLALENILTTKYSKENKKQKKLDLKASIEVYSKIANNFDSLYKIV